MSTATSSKRRQWRLSWPALLVALVAMAGVSIVLYPTVASWFSQYNQSLLIESYTQTIRDNPGTPVAEEIELAHRYNAALSSGALLESNERLPTGAGTSTDQSLVYEDVLDSGATGLMARLRIPAIDVDLPVYHGTADETLLRGAGHLEGTSLPVGGMGTHSVITAHRGLADATMFTNLNRVGIGDTFTLEVFGEVLTYEIFETKVVEPHQSEALRAREDMDLVTLVTCTPLGINSHRILVTAERVIPTPTSEIESAGAPPDIPHFPWWAVILGAAFVLASMYVWRMGYRHPALRSTKK